MTPEQFCYWLQGRAELMPNDPPSPAEWKMIGEHLATVFKKETPKLNVGQLPHTTQPVWPADGTDLAAKCSAAAPSVTGILRC